MSYALRRRAVAVAAAGLLAGLTLAGSPAWADHTQPEAAPNVDFSGGGLGLLLCGSKPNTAKISVPAETKIRLTNSLGQKATLKIDGASSASVGDGETVEVQFHRGPVSVAMVPECLLNLNPTFEPLTVDVAASTKLRTPSSPSTSPSSGAASSSTAPSRSPGTPSGSSSSAAPSSGRGSTSPGNEREADESPLLNEGDPLFPDELPGLDGEDVAAVDNLESPGATVVNPGGGTSHNLAGNNIPADKGPIGLLAIIATVCVVGVSAGAIRAIIAQRATRAEFA